jgi:putative transposase
MRMRRILIVGAAYHVTARINRKEACLTADSVKSLFLSTLAGAKKKYDFTVENFVIMQNHIHLLIVPHHTGTLPEIMRWLLGNFARKYNKLFGLSGHLWGDRYYSRPIIALNDYLNVTQYIDENPVKSNLVKESIEWRWNGLSHRNIGITCIISMPMYLFSLLKDLICQKVVE